jgi:hypothetical protein
MFNYPDPRSHRRHGPAGYANYGSYRPWLRDEFAFRCAYCLKREQWGQVTGEFDIDHFHPQTCRPDLAVEYPSLIYSCRRCNGVKFDHEVADPFSVMSRDRVRTMPDGTVMGVDAAATKLILQLDLNSPRLVEWRITWMRIADLARERDRELLQRLVGFPRTLPDLRRLRPPAGNTRPAGIAESWASLAKQGKLPDCY